MLDLTLIREQPDAVAAGIRAKGITVDLPRIRILDAEKRELQSRVEAIAAKKRAASGAIAKAKPKERERLLGDMRAVDRDADADRERLKVVERELHDLLWQLPNLPAVDVRVGRDDTENEVIRTTGSLRAFAFTPKPAWELGPRLGMFDTERAARVSGSRFGYLMGWGAKLEFALIRYAMRELGAEGFTPVIPPVLIGERAMDGMGYTLHGGTDESYYFEKDRQYLVGTSEQSIGSMHMDETFVATDLPKRYAGFSTCFRRESGSYGKDTKGIFRVHQFDKVEMFVFTTAEESDTEHERLLAIEERFVQALELPYRVVKMCSGDLGIPAARKYDIEAWFPSEQRYRELTSTSTCTDWQARRLNIRYRAADGGLRYAHMLNGTAYSMNRPICAIIENHQQEDGGIRIPAALRDDVGAERIVAV